MTRRPFTSILIANRGEIAVRIMRSCRELGIRTIAVYSVVDEASLHVLAADEAYCIGDAPAIDSYLSIEAVLRAASKSRAEAIHPGYGFLAENAGFAQAVVDAGLVWIGPPPAVIARLGDKVAAKDLARTVGVPVVPGYDGEDQRSERMLIEAAKIGFPVILKAAAGGGGKGMRTVSTTDQLAAELEGAKRESRSAFGDDRVFLEKLVDRPHHVEIQLLFDGHGNGVCLGDRDCSVQRRHQKVMEEAPSPAISAETRMAMGESALRLGRASGYQNAGTVEFLVSGTDFYFLEMNTRIQVEHPVTEMVTGLDLVRLQLEAAAGEHLHLTQEDIDLRGHAIEARVYAEDPENRFLPATGILDVLIPPNGPGIRNDVGVFQSSPITLYYDPMLAKLIVWAPTRGEAITRLKLAIEEYVALGVTTNLAFLGWVVAHPDFAAGQVDITWLERNWQPEGNRALPGEVAVAAALSNRGDTRPPAAPADPHNPWRILSGWRHGGMVTSHAFRYGSENVVVQLLRDGQDSFTWVSDHGAEPLQILGTPPGRLVLRLHHRVLCFGVATAGERVWVSYLGHVYCLSRPRGSIEARTAGGPGDSAGGATASMPGTVVKVLVTVGQRVTDHEPLMVLEAMKMEHVVEAPRAGVVKAILHQQGDMIPAGAAVVEIGEE